MTTQTNNSNNPNNGEKDYLASRFDSKILDLRNYLRERLDESKDFHLSIKFLADVVKTYDFAIIPLLNKTYENSSKKELFVSLYNKIYDICNGFYQEGLKKAESFGINPSEELPSKFPKSLEKMTFPENN